MLAVSVQLPESVLVCIGRVVERKLLLGNN